MENVTYEYLGEYISRTSSSSYELNRFIKKNCTFDKHYLYCDIIEPITPKKIIIMKETLDAIYCLIAIKQFRKSVLSIFPRDVFLFIIRMFWRSMFDEPMMTCAETSKKNKEDIEKEMYAYYIGDWKQERGDSDEDYHFEYIEDWFAPTWLDLIFGFRIHSSLLGGSLFSYVVRKYEEDIETMENYIKPKNLKHRK